MGINKRSDFLKKATGEKRIIEADRFLRQASMDIQTDGAEQNIRKARKALKFIAASMKQRFMVICALVLVIIILLIVLLAGGCNAKNVSSTAADEKATVAADENEIGTDGEAETITDENGDPVAPAELESSEQTALAEPVDIKMSFTGDFIIGTDEFFVYDVSFNAYHDMYGGEYFLHNVRDIFAEDDLTVINMECVLTNEETRLDKQFAFKGPPEYVDVLTGSSIEAANVANNHSYDYGEKSHQDTIDVLESNNIRTFGYDNVAMIDVKGVKVGLFGIYELDDHLERIPQVKECIAKLKEEGADIIVATFHWSNELVQVPDENQVILGHLAIDEGADLVVGHHPHILQGIDEYKGKTIAYSLGNFCFGGNIHPTETDTIIFQHTFSLDENKNITSTKSDIIPCNVSSDVTINNYQPMVLTGDDAQRVLDLVEFRSNAIVEYE